MNIEPSTSGRRPLRALVVDDDEFMLSFLSDMLRDLGVGDVRTARDGSAGSKACEDAKSLPDVVLCDINMPGTDGFQFMEQIAKRKFGGGVILISGLDSRFVNSASLMAKFHGLNILASIPKPVDRKSLSAALSKLG